MTSINNIIPNGSTVITKMGKIEAIVIGVCVRGEMNDHIEYNLSRFANGENKIEWVQSFEIEMKQDNSAPAGFINNNQKLIKE